MIVGYTRRFTLDQTAKLSAQERDLKAAGARRVSSDQPSSAAIRAAVAIRVTAKTLLATTGLMGALYAGALPASAATPWPLGVFPPVTAYSGGASSVAAFTALMGATAVVQNFYVDFTQTPGENGAHWLGSSNYNLGGFENNGPWAASTGVIPMGDIPMVSSASGYNTLSGGETVLIQYAEGTYDSMLRGMVDGWSNAGYKTQYWRPGVEMNLYSPPPTSSCAGNTTCDNEWIVAFQHIYTILHSEAAIDGVRLKVIWNPGLVNNTGYGNALANMWPGRAYVDVIGGDIYGEITPPTWYDWAANGQKYGGSIYDSGLAQFESNPINVEHYYSYPAANSVCSDASGPGNSCVPDGNESVGASVSLLNLIAFAEAQGLPIALCETGAGGNGDEGGDNAVFPAWLAATLRTAKVPVVTVSLWDSNGGAEYQFTGGAKPKEAAAFAANFGASAAPLITPHLVVAPKMVPAGQSK